MDQSNLKQLGKKSDQFLSYESPEKLTWCGGCGNYGIQKALERALVLEGLTPRDVLFCFDIGCNGNGSDKLGDTEVYTLHGLHGRVIPAAAGAAMANHKLKVIAEGGDGGTLSEGINHLVHAVRNNYPMVFILHNNENYGLTTGQASSTTRQGFSMNASPDGVLVNPMNVCEFVLGLKPTFVARSFSGDVEHMTKMIQAGLQHNGFAFIEIMQVCTTYNKATPQHWYWDKLRDLTAMKGYDSTDLEAARKACMDMDKEMKVGIFYQDKKSIPLPERMVQRQGVKTALTEEVDYVDIKKMMEGLK